jgi:hypothetical protein
MESTKAMETVKEELLESLEKMFEDLMMKEDLNYDRIKWELDYLIYPGIGSYIASGSLSKEDGMEIFTYCEMRLKELKVALENR